MRVCPRCQGRYDDESRFCPADGAPLPTPEADPRLGTVLLGQFELLEVCGRGAMGTVYRAWQSGMDREVAVKLLRNDFVKDPAVVKRFHREARSVARLHHPNIVMVFLVGETDDHVPFMVMEYVDGEPLSSELARGEPLPVGRALRIARQIASALAEAHGAGIIHRDLKPANILLEQRRRASDLVKVVDFGIAKIVGGAGGPAPGESALTRTGTIFGTPHYLSPEQGQGATVDFRADLYSLGVILFAMVTGRVPFDGGGMAVVVQHVNAPPPRPRELRPGLPPSVEALVLRLLEKDPAARPQSAEDVSDAIDALLVELGEPAAAAFGRAESQPPAPRRVGSQPSVPVVVPAPARRAVDPGTLTVKAGAVPPLAPRVADPGSVTVKGAPLQAPAPSGPPVTIKAGVLSPPPPGAVPPAVAREIGAADVTVPPPSMVRPAVSAPEPRRSAETAYAMPHVSKMAAVPMAPVPAMSSAVAVPASAMRPSSHVPVPAPPVLPPMPSSTGVARSPMDDAGPSLTWQPPSPWRRILLALGVLVLLGGAAAAAVYALGNRAPATLAAGDAGLAPSAQPVAGATAVADAAAATATVADASGAPRIGDLPDSAVAQVPSRDTLPPPPPVSSSERVITLGEGGWAVRVLLPSTILAGAEVDIAVEAWDPAGKPVDAHELRMLVEEPGGLERALTMVAVEQVGRFQIRRRFATVGRYEMRLYPAAGRSKPVVWFSLQVEDPETTGVMTRPEPARKAAPAAPARKKVPKRTKPAPADDYHLIDEGPTTPPPSPPAGGRGKNGPAPTTAPAPASPPPSPPPPKKDPGDADDLE